MGNASSSADERCLPCQFLGSRRAWRAKADQKTRLSSQEEDAIFRTILQVQPDGSKEMSRAVQHWLWTEKSPWSAPKLVASEESEQERPMCSEVECDSNENGSSKQGQPVGPESGSSRGRFHRWWFGRIVKKHAKDLELLRVQREDHIAQITAQLQLKKTQKRATASSNSRSASSDSQRSPSGSSTGSTSCQMRQSGTR